MVDGHLDEGLHKVIIQMTVDQLSSFHLFQKLEFQQETVLAEHVQDQHSKLRALIIMTYFTRDFWQHQDATDFPGLPERL